MTTLRLSLLSAAASLLAVGLGATSAQAVVVSTLDFGNKAGNFSPYVEDGFTIDIARLVKGNCVSGACLALNDNETSTVTQNIEGKTALSFESLTFELLGEGNLNSLIITAFTDAALTVSETFTFTADETFTGSGTVTPNDDPLLHNTTYTFTNANPLQDYYALVFSTVDGGNVRIDNLVLDDGSDGGGGGGTTPVPVPGALPLMMSGMAGLGYLARRRRVRNI